MKKFVWLVWDDVEWYDPYGECAPDLVGVYSTEKLAKEALAKFVKRALEYDSSAEGRFKIEQRDMDP